MIKLLVILIAVLIFVPSLRPDIGWQDALKYVAPKVLPDVPTVPTPDAPLPGGGRLPLLPLVPPILIPWMVGCGGQEPPKQPVDPLHVLAAAGGRVGHTLTGPPPSPGSIRDFLLRSAQRAGEAWAVAERAYRGELPASRPPSELVGAPAPAPTSGATLAAHAAASAGWSGEDLVMAVAVAGAESGFDPAAANPDSSARGLWQVMTSVHADKIGGRNILDPYVNAAVAHQIWVDANRTWQPWTVAGSGAYRAWLDEAEAAVAALPGTGVRPAGYDPAAGCEPGVIPAGDPGVAGAVIARAKTYLGVPYIRGGNDPAVGIDCSRLTELAYEAVGVDLPPVSWQQVEEGIPVSGLSDAAAGDLIFYGAPTTTHVALYLGGGRMIHAPRPGKVVEIVDVYGTPSFIRRVLVEGGGTV